MRVGRSGTTPTISNPAAQASALQGIWQMTYVPEESKVHYQSEKAFDALEWLAAMCSLVPNKGEQMVRYYGYYSNVSRGKRKMLDQDVLIPSILEPDEISKESRRNWARLIQRSRNTASIIPCPRSQSLPAVCLAGLISGLMLTRNIRKLTRLWKDTLPDF